MRNYLKKFATSIYFDILGVILVVGIAIASGYLGTRLDKFVDWGPITPYIPLGLISVINVGISMLSTRFTGKLKKSGNYLGIINTILSGAMWGNIFSTSLTPWAPYLFGKMSWMKIITQ